MDDYRGKLLELGVVVNLAASLTFSPWTSPRYAAERRGDASLIVTQFTETYAPGTESARRPRFRGGRIGLILERSEIVLLPNMYRGKLVGRLNILLPQ